jgi:hypothetical protein
MEPTMGDLFTGRKQATIPTVAIAGNTKCFGCNIDNNLDLQTVDQSTIRAKMKKIPSPNDRGIDDDDNLDHPPAPETTRRAVFISV